MLLSAKYFDSSIPSFSPPLCYKANPLSKDNWYPKITMLPQHLNSFGKEQHLRTDESEEALLGHRSNNDEESTPFRARPTYAFHWYYLTHGVLLLFCAFFFTAWVRGRRQCVDPPYCTSLLIFIQFKYPGFIFSSCKCRYWISKRPHHLQWYIRLSFHIPRRPIPRTR